MTLLALVAAGWMLVVGQARPVTGVVRDAVGAAIPGASVVAHPPNAPEIAAVTDRQGRFSLIVPDGPFTLVVAAARFQTAQRAVASTDVASLEITLAPAISEMVTVTAGRTEQRLTDVAGTVSMVDRARLDRSPAMTTDDVLRQVPAFSLFRRSSSVAAHPTAQGVSLRGIGPSGVSRTLVLVDGIPFNDPFGGWIAWTRVPRPSIERIEVVEGSGANLFGNYSMGGAINLVTSRPARPWIDTTVQYGERSTPRLDASMAANGSRWNGLLDLGTFRTDGYGVVTDTERGSVDENVSAESRRVYASASYRFADGTSIQGRADLFDESRQNGKRSTIDRSPEENDTEWSSFGVSARKALGTTEVRGMVFGDRVRFRSNFLAVPAANPPRSVGRMTLNQFVPSSSVGAAAQWTRSGTRSVWTAGLDWRTLEGESREEGLDPQTGTRVVLHRFSGGAQNDLGAFVQAVVTPVSPLVLTAAARHDRWSNTEGHNLETNESGQPTANHRPSLPDRSDAVTTPRLSALFKAAPAVSLWGAVGWGFRAPTLNELYRQFRVGTVTTLANEALGPERLRSIEAGVRLTPTNAMVVRGAWFDNSLRDAVSNVTVATAGTAVTQQRQNLGLTRIRGAQFDLEWRPAPALTVSAGYIFSDATVRAFDANPALVGKQLPQVPRHRGSAQLVVADPRFAELAITLHAAGRQFDDDLNVRAVPGQSEPGLPAFATVDFLVSRAVGRGISTFAGAQNLFDQRAFVGTLPTTLGAPRMFSVGVRWRPRLGGR